MRIVALCLMVCIVVQVTPAYCAASPAFSVRLQEAELVELPGIIHAGMDPQGPGEIDCNSPAHWDGETLYVFTSSQHPFRTSGPDLFHLSRPAVRVTFDNEAGWQMGGRWAEATHKAENGALYMWYHNEPPVIPGKTAPRIGAMLSDDNGMNWRDLGIVLEAPADSNNLESANFYFVGGNGDFCVVPDLNEEFIYFFISTYNKDIREQGVALARMPYADRDKPVGSVSKWHNGRWEQPGIGGHVTPIFPAAIDWHLAEVDAFWGPSVHFNTHLNAWVMLLNRAIDKDWKQEGIYVSFNPDLSQPDGWTKPAKILDATELRRSKWYPQVIGIDAAKRETDKRAGQIARLFIAGESRWEIVFLKPGEIAPAPGDKPAS